MYETHEDDTGHVLATYPTIGEALADTERLAEAIAAQLAANGEGHRHYFWVRCGSSTPAPASSPRAAATGSPSAHRRQPD